MPKSENYSVTWQDVRQAMLAIGRARNVRVQVLMSVYEPKLKGTVLCWRIEVYSYGVWPPKPPKTAVSITWPTSQFKTVPGALLWHLHEIEERLCEMEREAQRGLPF